MISAMASIGLTVALFIAGEAFKQEQLKAEAKMGALLSGLMGAVCILYAKTPLWPPRRKAMRSAAASASAAAEVYDESKHGDEGSFNRNSQRFQYDEEAVDVDDVAYIVAAALEKQYTMSRSAILARERKAIIAGRASQRSLDSAERDPAIGSAEREPQAPKGRKASTVGSVRRPSLGSVKSTTLTWSAVETPQKTDLAGCSSVCLGDPCRPSRLSRQASDVSQVAQV